MNLPPVFDWRNKRNLNPISVQAMNYSSYSLPDFTENKSMNGEIYMYDPDFKIPEMEHKESDKSHKSEPWLLKSALQACAMIFRKISGRVSSPDLSYHDCEPPSQESPRIWHDAKTENKNIEAHSTGFAYTDSSSDMNGDYQSVVASCEDKLNKVRQLITSKPVPSSPKCTTYRSRRRRRVFVESSSVEDSFEDAFCPEDFITNSKSDPLRFIIPYQYQKCDIYEVDAPKMKIETPVIDLKVPSAPENKEDLNLKLEIVKTEQVGPVEPEKEENKTNIEMVSSCESKMMQLQAMLKERRKKNTKTMLNSSDSAPESVKETPTEDTKAKIIPNKTQDKRYKNRHRLSTGKRKKAETKQLIHDDMIFADEIAEDPSSFENSPIIRSLSLEKASFEKSLENLGTTPEDSFDEVAGRFRSVSGTESDDSFQVVFADSPRAMRPSDCESEDSFIIFEDSPDSCYTSNDVFGSEESDSEYSDTDSEISDSGCGDSDQIKISQNMTKTFEDLTDDKLYSEDVVDSAVQMCAEISSEDLDLDAVSAKPTGLLLNDAKKLMRKDQPPKTVHFSENPPKVHVMRVWAFAARQARAGHWERHAIDRERFKRRIADADMALSWVLKPQHRSRVMFQRFMPWWNALKRKELAEKKLREAEEKKRLEEEKVKEELRLEEEKAAAESGNGEENVVEGKLNDEEGNNTGEENKHIDELNENSSVEGKNVSATVKNNTTVETGNIDKEKVEKSSDLTKQNEGNKQKNKIENVNELKNKQQTVENKQNNVVDNKSDKLKTDKEFVGKQRYLCKVNGERAKREIAKNKIEAKIVFNDKITNNVNKDKSVANTVKTTNVKDTVSMEIILRDDKCSVLPMAVQNEVIS